MTRVSANQYSTDGVLLNGFDYTNQAWVLEGVYRDCGHPQPGEFMPAMQRNFEGCSCYGRAHAGEPCTVREEVLA